MTEWLRVDPHRDRVAAAARCRSWLVAPTIPRVEAVARAGEAASIRGVSGLLTANPFYNKPSQEGQYRHFRAIAEAVPRPVVLYNIPSRTGVNLEPATILRLAEDCPTSRASRSRAGTCSRSPS